MEELRVGHQAVLHHLGEPCGEFALRQRVQGGGVGNDTHGLVKRADHVLGARVVDSGLAAHGGIHLGQERRWDLHETDAALEARCGKSRQVAHHPAPEGHDCGIPSQAPGDRRVEQALERGQGLVLLPVGDDVGVNLTIRESRADLVQVERCDDVIGHHQHLPAVEVRGVQLAACQKLTPDENRVAAGSKVHRQRFHVVSASSRFWISRTTCRAERRSVSTTVSATSRYRGSRSASSSRTLAAGSSV